MSRFAKAVAVLLLMSASSYGQTDNILHSFTGGTSDGSQPWGSVIQDGSALYGMTWGFNSAYTNRGVVFSIGKDGSNYDVTHTFSGNGNDGSQPFGSLTLSGSTLYGMTSQGGGNLVGAIFQVGIDGSGFGILHSFAYNSEGCDPQGSLILIGSTLYGMADYGTSGNGTIFKVGTDGNGFTVVHSFTGGISDGSGPVTSNLTAGGSTLYGMTIGGGSSNDGVIFKVGMDGNGYSLLHSFAGGSNDGAEPWGSLTLANGTLYGMTCQGGTANDGVIFKVGTDGNGFSILHTFGGGIVDGASPFGSLTLVGSTLYGTTGGGGVNNDGTVFEIGTDGNGFGLLYSFMGGDDGVSPLGDLTMDGSTLYGMTEQGGNANQGTVFSLTLPTPEPSTIGLLGVGAASLAAYGWQRKRRGA
jgi:uncharacterized repeat protein (TIGR03803 family)